MPSKLTLKNNLDTNFPSLSVVFVKLSAIQIKINVDDTVNTNTWKYSITVSSNSVYR